MPSVHPPALQTLYASLIEGAQSQLQIPLQTPGTAVRKTVKEQEYIYWRFYLANGRRTDEYLGPASDQGTLQAMEERLANSREARQIADSVKTLRLSGFAVADNSSALTVASLFNAGIFRQGGVLVGSHAFGALLNGLGIKLAANYYTDDIDIGTAAPIALAIPDDRSFLDVLRDTGIEFLEVPGLDHHRPPTSYKQRGALLKVDLLVPGTEEYETKPLPGLKAHATGLPFFEYLMSGVEDGYLLGKDHIVPVRLPNPARFALHKLIVSTLRPAALGVKSRKDQQQALVMMDAVLEHNQAWMSEAIEVLPLAARPRIAQAADQTMAYAEGFGDITKDALEELSALRYGAREENEQGKDRKP
ncbi:GSU2403 family nucleotidyltransferase fold protein [Paraburkholderia acidicola]|uniref:GSU2403 family nucleotidyltransferase fold protein n=1 Tax=Paraburkholderia acidicola TaxID=1912599 RepID=A0ABV1LU47_9BURK